MSSAKGADGRSSIHRSVDGGWEGWISLGVGPDGRRRRKHVRGRTRSAVAAKVREIEQSRDAGCRWDGRMPTVAEWLEHWIAGQEQRVRPTTMRGYRLDARRLGASGGRLDRLSPSDVEQLYGRLLADGLGGASITHIRRTLSAALSAAVRDGLLPAPHAVARARLPRTPPPREPQPLTVDEARRVLAAARRGPQGARWSVALALGLRQGEALGLRWQDLDLDRETVAVRCQLQWRPWRHGCAGAALGTPSCKAPGPGASHCPARWGGGPDLAEPKSAAGRRLLGLPGPLVVELAQHRAEQAAARLALGSRWDPSRTGWDLVFPGPLGGPAGARWDWQRWQALLLEAGVEPRRLHDARHTAATLLLALGVTTTTAGLLLGHTSPTATRRYQHLVGEVRSDAAARVGTALWGASG